MAQIHNLESKSRFGTKYIAGLLLIISSLLIAGWFGFFVFLPIKSGTTVIMDGQVPHKPQDPYGTGIRDLVIVSFKKK